MGARESQDLRSPSPIMASDIDHWKLNSNGVNLQSSTRQMIKTHQEALMANDGEDGNGLRYVSLKKRQDVSFSKVQVWLENH